MKNFLVSAISLLLLFTAFSCGSAEKNTGVFEFADIYLPNHTSEANKQLNLDNIDDKWGIWGHNLGVVLPETPSNNVFAKVEGGVKDDQFCFSSSTLYDYIVDYIRNNYSFSGSMNFAILPNDNGIVCLCNECVKLGNKPGNTAPSVFNMIEKLSKKFPQHKFFTSYYLTTQDLPAGKLPENAGVIISAIDFPRTAVSNPKEKDFMGLIESWKTKTDNIVVWDYVNNFDDYFTPSPIFSIMQHRLKLYRDAGVNGVFLNGSGDDYSVMHGIKKKVLADLIANPDADWEEALRKYTLEYYPLAGNDIADFMIMQENMVKENGKALPLYEGVPVATATYLPTEEFIKFYNKLAAYKKEAEGVEKEELQMMTDAMALTVLELKRMASDVEDTEILKKRLDRIASNGVAVYNEGCWSVADYLKNYEFMERYAQETQASNLLLGVPLVPVTALDEDYTDVSILTDGLLGIPSNYHDGNLITSADPAFSISIPRQPGMKTLRLWLVYNPGFKIGLPESVYVTVGGVKGKVEVPEKPASEGHTYLDFDVSGGGDIVLTLRKDPEVKTMAIDEIQAF